MRFVFAQLRADFVSFGPFPIAEFDVRLRVDDHEREIRARAFARNFDRCKRSSFKNLGS